MGRLHPLYDSGDSVVICCTQIERVISMAGTRLKNLSRRDFGRLSMVALGGALAGTSRAGPSDKSHMAQINGNVAPGFERVKDVFTANFEKRGDVGTAFSLYHRGVKVVDLWGGVADEVAGPLGLDFWIGLPASEENRVVPIIGIDLQDGDVDQQAQTEKRRALLAASRDPDSLLNRPSTTTPLDMNSRAFHAAEIPAGNGITDARSLARMYASLIGDGVDGVRLLNDETVARRSPAAATRCCKSRHASGLGSRSIRRTEISARRARSGTRAPAGRSVSPTRRPRLLSAT